MKLPKIEMLSTQELKDEYKRSKEFIIFSEPRAKCFDKLLELEHDSYGKFVQIMQEFYKGKYGDKYGFDNLVVDKYELDDTSNLEDKVKQMREIIKYNYHRSNRLTKVAMLYIDDEYTRSNNYHFVLSILEDFKRNHHKWDKYGQ